MDINGGSQNGWLRMDNPKIDLRMDDDLGLRAFHDTPHIDGNASK